MGSATRHLKNSHWILLGILVAGVAIAALFIVTDSTPQDEPGGWKKDDRGVWVAEGKPFEKPADVRQQEFLIREAQMALEVFKRDGKNLTGGPCLGTIFNGWVADVAHSPRQPVDDRPENQCEEYRNGTAQHFVELDAGGEVIDIQ